MVALAGCSSPGGGGAPLTISGTMMIGASMDVAWNKGTGYTLVATAMPAPSPPLSAPMNEATAAIGADGRFAITLADGGPVRALARAPHSLFDLGATCTNSPTVTPPSLEMTYTAFAVTDPMNNMIGYADGGFAIYWSSVNGTVQGALDCAPTGGLSTHGDFDFALHAGFNVATNVLDLTTMRVRSSTVSLPSTVTFFIPG
jgi:hypothetical protein